MLVRTYGIPLPPYFPPKHQGSVIANEPTGYSSWLMAGLGQKSATAISRQLCPGFICSDQVLDSKL